MLHWENVMFSAQQSLGLATLKQTGESHNH